MAGTGYTTVVAPGEDPGQADETDPALESTTDGLHESAVHLSADRGGLTHQRRDEGPEAPGC
jgi:hypothetical protein